jgi:hypothetical protein
MGASGAASEIEHVTVYARGARVRRVTAAGLAGATGEVRITGLPLAVSDDSVRAEVRGTGVVTGVRVELDAATTDERAGDGLDQAVRAARIRVAAVDAELARIGVALAGLGALAPVARRSRPDGAAVPAWSKALDARLAILDLRVAREAELRAALDAAQRDKRAAVEALAAAQDRAARASTGRGLEIHELCKTVVATVEGATAASRIAIEYLVAAARWAPTYCLRLAGAADHRAGDGAGTRRTAELELRAVVAQNTGEDWHGVRLTLSTAEPMRFAELPELPMARIGRRQAHVARRGFRAPPTGVDALYQDFDRAFPGRGPRPASRSQAEEFAEVLGHEEITQDRAVAYAQASSLGAGMPPPPPAEFDTDEVAAYAARGFDDEDVAISPPVPPPAPPGAPVPVLRAPSRSRAGLAGVGAVLAAPVAVAGALGSKLAKKRAAPRGGGGARELEEAEAGDLLGDDATGLLAYGELRMMPAGHARRGRLVHTGAAAQYHEALAARGIALAADADLAGAVEWRIAQIEALNLPPGTSARWDHHYDHAFPGEAPVDVASDGTWHAVSIAARSAPVTVRHVVVPRERTEVYRVAELANPLGGPLLPGPIDVFDDGVYLLTSAVDSVPAGGAVELGLGVDPAVKAARNTTFREESAGMLRGRLQLHHEIAVELVNHSPRAVDVEVRERLPVVPDGTDDVEVIVTRTEPRWERWSPEPGGPRAPRLQGGHRWRVAVPAGETRKLVAAYEVRIAARHELVGGNRREA